VIAAGSRAVPGAPVAPVARFGAPILTTSMPIYEYRCPKGHTFEVMQSINDAPVKECQVCGRPVERVLHSPAVHFKGSGFYNTDYGTKKRQREKSASGEGGSGESSTTTTTSSDAGSGSGESKTSSATSSGGSSSSDSSGEKAKPAKTSD
jgi:putative FmdB family regulatory protein